MEKNTTETYGMLQTAFVASYMNRASVFERFKEGRESVRDDERCGRSKEVNAPVHNSILQPIWPRWASRQFLTSPYSPDLAPCDFCLFPKLKEKLKGCCYETIEKMKEAVTKVIDTLTQEDFHGASQKLLERYNKCIAAGGDYFEGDLSFMCVVSIKVPIRKSIEIYLMSLVTQQRRRDVFAIKKKKEIPFSFINSWCVQRFIQEFVHFFSFGDMSRSRVIIELDHVRSLRVMIYIYMNKHAGKVWA